MRQTTVEIKTLTIAKNVEIKVSAFEGFLLFNAWRIYLSDTEFAPDDDLSFMSVMMHACYIATELVEQHVDFDYVSDDFTDGYANYNGPGSLARAVYDAVCRGGVSNVHDAVMSWLSTSGIALEVIPA